MNTVNLIGRITAVPELQQTTDGKSVISFTLAVKRPHSKDTTDFLRCKAWAHTAEYVARYAGKGDIMAVSGYITVREYESNGMRKVYTEIQADDVQILNTRQATAGDANPFRETVRQKVEETLQDLPNDEDLPF